MIPIKKMLAENEHEENSNGTIEFEYYLYGRWVILRLNIQVYAIQTGHEGTEESHNTGTVRNI